MSNKPQKKNKLNLEPIYTEISKLLLIKNPEQISFSLAARVTQIPRTTLYYYFNSKIENLITESVRYSIKTLMQLWDLPPQTQVSSFTSWDELQNSKFKEAISTVLSQPWILRLYFRYCRDQNYIGQEIRFIKDSYLRSNHTLWTQYHKENLNPKTQIFISNIKLGILWGLLDNENTWRLDPELLAKVSTKFFSHIAHSKLE